MWKQIFKATFIAGCLDITAACLQAWIVKNIAPGVILQYIASGIFGKDAFSGGTGYMAVGLLIHFFIAFACAMAYFLVYPGFKLLHNKILLSALFVATVAWTVTTRLIVPISKIVPAPLNLSKAIIAIVILYFCIGLPICFLASRYYHKHEN